MNRVGIITRHISKNYGTMLQAYAIQKYIENLGFDCEIIDYRAKDRSMRIKWLHKIKHFFYAMLTPKKYIMKFTNKKNIIVRNKIFNGFSKTRFRISTKRYETMQDLKNDPPDYDIYVCGSDQIWNPYLEYKSPAYFLTFVPEGKKTVAYAPSIGVSNIGTENRLEMKDWLKSVQYLSAREKRGCEIIQEITKRPVELVLDPVLLHSPEEWDKIAISPELKEPYILCYFLGNVQFFRDFAREIQKATGYKIVNLPKSYLEMGSKDHKIYDAGPAEFLGLIKNAAVVCTDSFHGTIFSVNYHKPFFCFCRTVDTDERSENSRIYNILEVLQLQSRLIKPDIEFSTDMLKLDYSIAHGLLEHARYKSAEYIRKALEQ